MATLSLKNIQKIYPHSGGQKKPKKKTGEPEKKSNLQITNQGVIAVQSFNLEIADKEFIVLVGPSGCGKSTTLRMVAGLEEISAGELYIDGNLVNDVEPKNRDIAMVFQSYALYPQMTVYDNIAFVGEEPYEKFEHGHAFLCGVYAGCACVANVVDAVEYHLAVVVEFG